MHITIMVVMKFAEKCPKCGGFVQTKSIRKSIGFAFMEIPVAQFCLNPVCDWYQDFAETKKPEDIKKIGISRNQIYTIAAIIGFILIYGLFSYIVPANDFNNDLEKNQQLQTPELGNNPTTPPDEIPSPAVTASQTVTVNVQNNQSASTPAAVLPTLITEPKNYSIRFDVSHGFVPPVITINISDTITWSSEENQRIRLLLVSKDDLFTNQLLQYHDRYKYQFKQQGKYEFILADYEPYKEYKNAISSVIVR